MTQLKLVSDLLFPLSQKQHINQTKYIFRVYSNQTIGICQIEYIHGNEATKK